MKTFMKTFRITQSLLMYYAALTNPYTIELWSGYPAEMSTEPGSEFSLWEGDITGRNIAFEADRKVATGVVFWRAGSKIHRYNNNSSRSRRLRSNSLNIQIYLTKILMILQRVGGNIISERS
jgi:activator of HSP90 ATPase